jgi:hypothetical protein
MDGTPNNPLGCSHVRLGVPRLGEGARQCYFVGIPNCRAPETAVAASGLERLLSDSHSALGRRVEGWGA